MAVGFRRSPLAFIIPHGPVRLAVAGITRPGFRSMFEMAGIPFHSRPSAAAAPVVSAGGIYIPIPRRRRRR